MMRLLVGIVFCLTVGSLFAQTTPGPTATPTPKPTNSNPTVTPTPGSTTADQVPPVAEKKDIGKSSLVQDVRTAGYYDLFEWCRRLGLETTGGVPELRQRVAQKLGVTLPDLGVDTSKQTLTIDSAQEAGFVTVESPGKGKELRLSGGLKITLVDNEKKVTHVIKAGELWFDQEQQEMTARGNVEYTMIHGASQEVFRGESLTFRLSDSEGIFYGGSSSRDRTVGSQALKFRFSGDAIRRSGEDVILLDDGSITSSPDPDNPNYQIRAHKIWILAPGEWGLQDAVLYIGRIPVFYFPFYFQPGDDFFFNPVLSIPATPDRRGTSLQTTTYLLGTRKKDSAPLSFLQLDDGNQKSDERVIRGLYMVKGKSTGTNYPPDWSLKILADFYANLGLLTGVVASLPNLGPFKTATASFGLGITRNVTIDGNPFALDGISTNFNPFLSQWEQSTWNGSYFMGNRLPFRWGGTMTVDTGIWNLSMEYYSDPSFWNDLTWNRSETFSPFTLLGLSPNQALTAPGIKTSLNWSTMLNLPPFQIQPWAINTSVTAKSSLLLISKTNASVVNTSDPTYYFYTGKTIMFPDIASNFDGVFWDLKAGTAPKPNPTIGPPRGNAGPPLVLPDLKMPSWDGSATSAKEETPKSLLEQVETNLAADPAPIPIQSNFALAAPQGWDSRLKWILTPTLSNEIDYDDAKTPSPQTSSWIVKNSQLSAAANMKLTYTLSNDFWSFQEDLADSNKIQKNWYIDPNPTDPTLYQTQMNSDARQTSINVTQTMGTTVKPFTAFDPLKESSAVYNLTSNLWTYSPWNNNSQTIADTTTYWDGGPDSVPVHQFTGNLVWQIIPTYPSLKATSTWQSDLLPRKTNEIWTNLLELQYPWGSAHSKTIIRNTGGDWLSDPWETGLTWTPMTNVSLDETFLYDTMAKRPQSSTTTLVAFGFTARYRQLQTNAYNFNSSLKQWVPEVPTRFVPQELAFEYHLDIPVFRTPDNRQKFSAKVNSTWPINLQQYTQMPLNLDYTVNYSIFRFLEFSISETVSNSTMYRYFPFLVNNLGVAGFQATDFFQDLGNSLKFWDEAARRQGSFKMQSLNFSLIHYLDDWTLTLKYTGAPQSVVGSQQLQWANTLTLLIQWSPVPELKSNFQWDQNGQLSVLKSSP